MKEDNRMGKTLIFHIYHRTENKTTLKITFDLKQDDYRLS